jgi:hypothetical protein
MDGFNIEADVMTGAHNTYADSVRMRLRKLSDNALQGIVDDYEARPLLKKVFGGGGVEYVEAKFLLESRVQPRYRL